MLPALQCDHLTGTRRRRKTLPVGQGPDPSAGLTGKLRPGSLLAELCYEQTPMTRETDRSQEEPPVGAREPPGREEPPAGSASSPGGWTQGLLLL